MAGDQSVVPVADFYISYADSDRAWVEWIASLLEATDYQVAVAPWGVAPGAHSVDAIKEGARHARNIIAVISGAYLDAIHDNSESHATLTVDQIGHRILPIYVEDFLRPTVLDREAGVDLFDLTENTARARLIHAARTMVKPRGGETASTRDSWQHRLYSTSIPESRIPPFPGYAAGRRIDSNEVVFSALLQTPAAKRQRRSLARIARTASQALRPPRPPDRRELEAASNARWTKLEERLDHRFAWAGPPSDEHRQPPSTIQPEDPR